MRLRPTPRCCGFSVPELMVALALGLLLVGAVFMSYAATLAGSRHQRALGEMGEGATLALSLLRRDLLQAGYIHPDALDGDRFMPADPVILQRAVFGCDRAFVAASANVGQGQCNPVGAVGDAIEINFEAARDTALQTADGRLADCVGNALKMPSGQDQPGAATERTRIPAAHRYFVLPAVANGPPVALACASARSGAERLVPHVEALHIRYGVSAGWQADDPSTRRPQRYVAAKDFRPIDWPSVVAVRLCVLMRSAGSVLPANEAQTSAYRDCEGQQQNSNDGVLRRAFVTTVGLRNREAAQ